MIGKGPRSQAVIDAIIRNRAVYLCAVGGAGALAAQAVESAEIIAFPELGCEAVRRLVVKNFPLYVAIDCSGGNLFGA
jgi:fumarate hydratase subunit beta